MTQKAAVEHGIIFDIGPDMPAYPDGMVVDVPDNAQRCWTWDGKVAAAPVAPVPSGPRTAPGPTLVKAATDDAWAKVKPRDQACIAGRASVPETLDMIARAATAMGTTPKAWFDAALGVTG